MNLFKKIFFLFIPLILFVLSGCQASQEVGSKSNIYIENGVINLSDWDFNKNGNIRLDGEWEFYWSKLLTYNELNEQTENRPIIAKVPSDWNYYKIDNKNLQGQGFATYRLHVKTAFAKDTLLSICINNFASSYTMFVNEKEIASNGKVATSKEEYIPEFKPLTATFIVPSSEFDIIIQVANYDFYAGGLWYPIYLGQTNAIEKFHNLTLSKELFTIGVLSIVAIYFFGMFLMNRKEKAKLYFSIICFISIFAIDSFGDILIAKYLFDIPFKLFVFTWYTSWQWGVLFLVLYSATMFKCRCNKIAVPIFIIATAFITAMFFLVSLDVYTFYAQFFNYIMFTEVLYCIFIAFVGLKNKIMGAALYLIAMSSGFITMAHDILYIYNQITTEFGKIAFIGVFVFIFSQMITHAKYFAYELSEKERLLIEVEKSRDEVVVNEIKFLQAQIKPHFLYNTLSVIASLITRNPVEAKRIIIKFGEYLRSSFDFDNNNDFEPILKSIELTKAYVEIEKARFRNRIQFNINCNEVPYIYLPRLSIQPLVENAVRHGILKKSIGGTVALNITKEYDRIKIEVTDNGVGMTDDMAENLLKTHSDSKGVGIKNIQRRLLRFYGQGLHIESELGKGTKMHFYIPFNKKDEV